MDEDIVEEMGVQALLDIIGLKDQEALVEFFIENGLKSSADVAQFLEMAEIYPCGACGTVYVAQDCEDMLWVQEFGAVCPSCMMKYLIRYYGIHEEELDWSTTDGKG
jgi:hypothetical protein